MHGSYQCIYASRRKKMSATATVHKNKNNKNYNLKNIKKKIYHFYSKIIKKEKKK